MDRAHATKNQPPARAQRAHAAQSTSLSVRQASRAARTAAGTRHARHAPGAASTRRTCAGTPPAARHATARAQHVGRGRRREAARRGPVIACNAQAPRSTLFARGARAAQRLLPGQCRRGRWQLHTAANAQRSRRTRLLVDASARKNSPRYLHALERRLPTDCAPQPAAAIAGHRRATDGPRASVALSSMAAIQALFKRGVRWRCSAGSGKCSGAAGHLWVTPRAQADATQTQVRVQMSSPVQ